MNAICQSAAAQLVLFATAIYFIAYEGWGAVLASAPIHQ